MISIPMIFIEKYFNNHKSLIYKYQIIISNLKENIPQNQINRKSDSIDIGTINNNKLSENI